MRIWTILERLRLYGLTCRLDFNVGVGGVLLTDRSCSFAGVNSAILKANNRRLRNALYVAR